MRRFDVDRIYSVSVKGSDTTIQTNCNGNRKWFQARVFQSPATCPFMHLPGPAWEPLGGSRGFSCHRQGSLHASHRKCREDTRKVVTSLVCIWTSTTIDNFHCLRFNIIVWLQIELRRQHQHILWWSCWRGFINSKFSSSRGMDLDDPGTMPTGREMSGPI